jgi:DNA-binding MarR family transcriptional regulator
MVSREEHFLWHNLHSIVHAITRHEEDIFSKTDITHQQHSVLMTTAFLAESTKAPVKITDLAARQNRSPVSISLIIGRMESKGLVKKVRDPADRRIIKVTITKKGKELLKLSSNPTTELVKRLFSTLSDKEIKQATVITDKLIGRLGLNSNKTKSYLEGILEFINKMNQKSGPSLPGSQA